MQMAVNVFELAGAPKLIGEHFIAPYYSVVGFQLVVESILTSNSEGARFAPSITSSVKAALHSEGAQTFPSILSVQPHGPAPKLIVICDWTKISQSFETISQYFLRENVCQQQQRCMMILLTFSMSLVASSASLAASLALALLSLLYSVALLLSASSVLD